MKTKTSSWLDYTDADHDEWNSKWTYTEEVYSGKYTDDDKVKRYLNKRAYWEKNDAYSLRVNSSDPDLSLFTLLGSIVGQALATEDDDTREYGELGSPSDPDTIMSRLWNDADGEGTNYEVLWKQFGTKEMVFQWMYVLIEGIDAVEDEDGNVIAEREARIVLIDPRMVLAKAPDGSWMKVKHEVPVGGDSPQDKQEVEEQYTVYSLDGWTRYRKVKSGRNIAEEIIGEGTYEFYRTKRRVFKRIPIYLVKLPFEVYVAHYLARKVVVIFNQESCRDTFLGEGTTTHLVEDGDPMVYEAHKDDISAGETHHNVDPASKMYYIAPPDGPARLATDVLKDKRENLAIAAFQQYGNAAKQATATEIRQEARSGIEAFLRLYVSSMDEAENTALFLLEQVYFPNEPEKWGQAYVERSKKFAALDPISLVNMVTDLAFGPNALPLTSDMLLSVIRFVWENHLGFSLDAEQEAALLTTVEAHIENKQGTRPGLTRIREAVTNLRGLDATNEDLQAAA